MLVSLLNNKCSKNLFKNKATEEGSEASKKRKIKRIVKRVKSSASRKDKSDIEDDF